MEESYGMARLQTLSLADLCQGQAHTRQQLLDICVNDGFFYLEVDAGCQLGKAMKYFMDFTRRLFDVSDIEKGQSPFQTTGRGNCLGFKAAGTELGAFGTPDGFELYMLPYNELVVAGYPHELIGPELLRLELDSVTEYVMEYHQTGLLVLDQLSKALGLGEDENLVNAHEPQTPNTSSMTFLKYVDSVKGGHVSHTDLGTLTFLYTMLDGLQIFHPTDNSWLWVEPRENHLVVNVGDSLTFLTNKRLKSSLHRVIPHANAQGRTRLSFAYFMRPSETVSLEVASGSTWSSKDWYLKKASLFAAPHEVQAEYIDLLQGRI